MPIGSGSHFEGPVLGSGKSFGGIFENVPQWAISQAASKYKVYYEDFKSPVADATALGTLGWAATAVGAVAANTTTVTTQNGFLLINAGTAADTGWNLQYNLSPITAAASAAPHQIYGPVTSTATLMDDRELIFATRIGYAQLAGVWAAGIGSKVVIGWTLSPDIALMTPTTGALTIGTGGGMVFHITEAGRLNFVTQRTTTPATAITIRQAGTFPDATSATVVGNWIEFGFRAVWDDASDNAANGYVQAFVNGQLVGTKVNDMPMSSTEVYSVSIEVLNGPAASPDIDLGVDYIMTAISRPGTTKLT